ncbi:MAG: glycosyltransferase family 4 protein [Bacteroidia bacterium]|nr:glycosyltransferase family 4 protein [Bacteroidia bacterium]MDW8302738.1 glycosyltransferase family 4 protein [Bacteroidia bacterium]
MQTRKMLVICPYPERVAPSQRLKYEQYFDYFRQNGYEITVSPFMTMKFWNIVYKKGNLHKKVFWTIVGYLKRIRDLLRIRKYDIVFVTLWVTPIGPPIMERLFALLAKSLVYDIDDLIFLGHSSAANKIIAWMKGKRKMIVLMKHADHVITCTPVLDRFVRQYNPNTTDISSTINTDTYIPVNPYNNEKTLVLGWSGSHSTAKYLHLLTPVLQKLKQTHSFKLLVMGDENFKMEGLEIEALAWSEDKEIPTLQRMDIGLYPLPDEPWVYGKSGLKALQYMALGIPTVAQKLGPDHANHRVIEHGVSGFLADTHEEWLHYLTLLMDNPDLRKKIGTAARERVVKYYSIHANKDTYLNILNTVAAKRTKK